MEPSVLEPAIAAPRERDGSGHGLLLVILGEFVWQSHEEAEWLSTLVRALAALDITENATRKALQRTGEADLLSFDRQGRLTRCSLTATARATFEEGARRVFSFEPQLSAWDGRWLVLALSVPETKRKLRHLLWGRLQRAGLGSPVPGIWISPHADLPIGRMLGAEKELVAPLSFVGPMGSLGEEAEMVSAAWNLAELAELYREFSARYADLRPQNPREVFEAYVGLIQAWRRFPFLDPRLPTRFLPDAWAGVEAAKLFKERRAAWRAPAQQFWETLRG